MQSTSMKVGPQVEHRDAPCHVAIIMDGNRRWARRQGLPREAGHRRGLDCLERLLPAVRETSIRNLTLFGFASANWQRSEREVSHLMGLVERALQRFTPICVREGLALEVIGRKDRLPATVLSAAERCRQATAGGQRRLRIALDYSARTAILNAAGATVGAPARGSGPDADAFAAELGAGGDVDLLIRTGGERRLSDFLLWECAFAELYFSDLYWPEFTANSLFEALDWYQQRNRRFGR